MVAGVKLSTGYNDWFAIPNLLPNAPEGFSWETGPRGLYESSSSMEAGPLTSALPLDPFPGLSSAGSRLTSFFDDFYNRIYVTPTSIDFGAISDNAQVTVRVWNAFFEQDTTLTSIGYDSSAGLQVTGAELPWTLLPLGIKDFTVTATLSGPAILDHTIVWSFDLPYSLSMPVTGSRAKAWVFEPNWPPSGKSYQIAYEYKTEIITSRSGKEQRIALRASPRKNLSYACLLTGEQFRQYKDLIWSWQHRSFVMPEITRFVDSVTGMAAGTATMDFGALPAWAVPEATVMLSASGLKEIRVIESVAGSVATFKTIATTPWPAQTRMFAALAGSLATSLSTPRETNAVAQVDLKFKVAPLSEVFVAPAAAATTFNGREVFLKRPNWARALDVENSHEVDDVDYGRGAVVRYTPVEYGVEQRRAVYLNRNAQDAQAVLDFFDRMRGRQGEFYMPTWEYDFQPKVLAGSGSAAMRVSGTRLFDSYNESTVQKAMFVMLLNGTVLLRTITSITKVTDGDGTDSLITVSSTWGTAISQDTIVMCGWLPAWRLASDSLTVEWVTNSVANVQMTMQTLEDLPVITP